MNSNIQLCISIIPEETSKNDNKKPQKGHLTLTRLVKMRKMQKLSCCDKTSKHEE